MVSLKFSGFEWDGGNKEKNLKKHGATCEEIEEVFYQANFTYPDERHSTELEKRYVLFGEPKSKRPLLVVFTLKGSKVRVISARDMSQKERNWYGEEKKKISL